MEQMKNQKLTNLYTFTDEGVVGNLEVNGSLPTDGTIRIDDTCKTEVAVSNKDFCANKSYDSDNLEIVDLKDGKCIGFNNNVDEKISVEFVGDTNVSVNDLKSSISKNNELVYEFSLKNNSTSPVNYKLQFDNENKFFERMKNFEKPIRMFAKPIYS